MKIAVLGAGAMGMLIGGMLSRANDVTLIDINSELIDKINKDGIIINEKDNTFHIVRPSATVNAKDLMPVDLIIVFVKAMYSKSALNANKNLIGPDTYIMTLQNGSGHEDTLIEFTDEEHVVIGTTQHNSSIKALGEISHGGIGLTYLGGLNGEDKGAKKIALAFNAAQIDALVDSNIKKLIWGKMFTNVSASALTAVLQCPLGFISGNKHAWNMCKVLINEAVEVAHGEGIEFNVAEEIEAVKKVCDGAPNGLTSIYADIKAGRKTEVDTISGSVVKAGKKNGVDTPNHSLIVNIIHAKEDYNETTKEQ